MNFIGIEDFVPGFSIRGERYGFWGKLTALFFAAVLFFSLSSCALESSSPTKDQKYSARYAIDGDTLELSTGKRVRYIGVDAPEIRRKQGSEWVFSPEVYGIEAKERNAELIMGKSLRLEFDEEKEDKYGRSLAYVYADGVMVNMELIEEGFATVYTFPPNLKYYKEMNDAQRGAIEGKRGLWGAVKNITASEAGKYSGMFCLVKGRVSDTTMSRGRITLYFAQGEKSSLELVIYSRNLQLFYSEGIDPLKYYEARNIEVFGKIEGEGSRFEMVVDNPFQIKVL